MIAGKFNFVLNIKTGLAKKEWGARIIASLIVLVVLWAAIAIAGVNNDLIDAVMSGDLPKVKDLVTKGADVNATDPYGYTVLTRAIIRGYLNPELFPTDGQKIIAKPKL